MGFSLIVAILYAISCFEKVGVVFPFVFQEPSYLYELKMPCDVSDDFHY